MAEEELGMTANFHHCNLPISYTTQQPCLAQELEEGKKKKKKKITLDFVAAEVASLVSSGGSDETPTPQLDEESQRTGATPHRVTEPEEHGHKLELLEEKLEKTGLESLEESAFPESVTISRQLISSTVNPTTVTDHYWVRVNAPHKITSSEETFGKWLVFKQLEELDEIWHMIRKAVESGELGALCIKCSTAMPDPSSYPIDPSNKGVICIYTSENAIDEVGFKLVHLVKQDICYKTEEATRQGLYIRKGCRNVSLKAIYWNDGEPSFERKGWNFKGSWRGGRHRGNHAMGDWRLGMGGGERNPLPHHSQGGYHYHGGRGYDRYHDHGPTWRSDEGHPCGYHPQHRSLEGHHNPYSDRGPPQRYERGSRYHDPSYGDHGPPWRYDEGYHYRHHYSSDHYHARQRSLEDHHEQDRNELPKERPRLHLQPRTRPLGDTSGGREGGERGKASSSIFGLAKPVDTAAREREIEERLLKERDREQGGIKEERGDRSLMDEGGKRGERRNESSQRERSGERGRYDSTGRGEKGERCESSGRGERRDGNCPPHDGWQDTTEATGRRGRRTESHEGKERASEEEEGGGRPHPL